MIVITDFLIKSRLMYISIKFFSDMTTDKTYYVGDVITSDKPGNCNTTEEVNNCIFVTSM